MTSFAYRARDKYGVLSSGIIDAEDSKAVALQLEKFGFTPVSITPSESAGIYLRLEKFFVSFQKVKTEELIVFTRQLSSILEAGVPLVEGLDAVHDQIKDKRFREIVYIVRKDIEGGSTFSDALEKHGAVFTPLVVNMVRAGEKAGILDDVLNRISNLLEKDVETRDKIKSATRYPLIVMGVLVLAFVVLTLYVIPKFVSFFSAFQADLPLPTKILVNVNYLATRYWYWVLGVIFTFSYLFKRYLDTAKGRYTWDRLLLSSPLFGPLLVKINLSRFARMLAAMLRSGIPILEALTITSATVGNKVISRVILDVRDEVSGGKSLAEPMQGSVFPPICVAMVAIGEKAGNLEGMLNKVADYFDREADYTIRNLTPLLEPILILGLGVIMLIFALGIFLPMWDLIKVYKKF